MGVEGGSIPTPVYTVIPSTAVTQTPVASVPPTVFVGGSSSLTVTQINSIISLLESFGADASVISNVRLSLGSSSIVPKVSTPTGVSAVFTRGLGKGSSNSDVKRLQQLLNSDSDTLIAPSGVGSPGNETVYFGSLTEKAVQKFQMKYGVVKSTSDAGYGYIGPKTRTKLAEVFGE